MYSAPTMAFLLALKGKTNLAKYQHDKEKCKHLEKAMANEVYGGSVLLPVGEKSKKRTKANPLYDEITLMEKKAEGQDKIAMDILKGGGYYILNNVRLDKSSNEFADIYLLAESIQDKNLREKLDEVNEVSASTGILKKPKVAKKGEKQEKVSTTSQSVFWNDIQEALTGYARIIYYKNHSSLFRQMDDAEEVFGETMHFSSQSAEHLEVTMISEGRIDQGVK